jgi:hypothetical protein
MRVFEVLKYNAFKNWDKCFRRVALTKDIVSKALSRSGRRRKVVTRVWSLSLSRRDSRSTGKNGTQYDGAYDSSDSYFRRHVNALPCRFL